MTFARCSTNTASPGAYLLQHRSFRVGWLCHLGVTGASWASRTDAVHRLGVGGPRTRGAPVLLPAAPGFAAVVQRAEPRAPWSCALDVVVSFDLGLRTQSWVGNIRLAGWRWLCSLSEDRT